MPDPFRIVFILYPRLTQLDFTGPYEVLARLPGAEIVIACKNGGVVDTEAGLKFADVRALADIDRADMIMVPGGPGQSDAMLDPEFMAEVKRLGRGGAYLNAFLARAQVACCTEVEQALAHASLDAFDDAIIAMFEAEWRRQGRTDALRRVAIVDEQPGDQYLYPEFLLARRLFERCGIEAVIADARELRFDGNLLQHGGRPLDLVYNRLVDFSFAAREHTALRTAYEGGAVVVTPNPRNHALLADKRNLTLLSNPPQLARWGLDVAHAASLAGVPATLRVKEADAETLWSERKGFFFKPACGHGGKAVYRGDKLTRGTWGEILEGDYIAQRVAPPSERTIKLDGERVQRKVDVRLYTYDGEILIAAARLYQGQTTNFRTLGGGFAPVFFI